MQHDSRLSGVLHILLHLAQAQDPVTSATLARMLHTNPVVIRRLLAGLRTHGLVQSEKGHGGGWWLACDVHTVTLYDIYAAVGMPGLFALGNRTESPGCRVEAAVNTVLNDALQAAEAVLLARLRTVTLSAVGSTVAADGQGCAGGHTQHAAVESSGGAAMEPGEMWPSHPVDETGRDA